MLSFFSFWLGTGTGMWPPRLVAPRDARRIVSSTLRKTAKRQSTAIVTAREKVSASADQKVVECVEWDVDPISRERLKSDACDAIRIGQNIFHLPTLVTYLNEYDDVRLDPVSRTALTQQELELINARASALGIEVRLPTQADEVSCQRRRSHSDEILTLECLLGEVVSELREMIGDDMDTPAAPNSWLSVLPYGLGGFDYDTIFRFTMLCSKYGEPFSVLKAVSVEAAHFALQSHIVLLRGPPRKPNRDGPKLLLTSAIDFLQSHWTQGDAARLREIRGL